jgi:hypothetical protein
MFPDEIKESESLTASTVNEDFAVAYDLMQSAIKIMSEFPADFLPSDEEMPKFGSVGDKQFMRGVKMEEILSDPEAINWLNGVIAALPEDFFPVFVSSSGFIAHIIEGFGAKHERGMLDLVEILLDDPESQNLMSMLKEIRQQKAEEKIEDSDPMNLEYTAITQLNRRRIARRVPFARSLTTLLGEDALIWLTTDSRNGIGKIQPHEFSRTGWQNIWTINNQLKIEEELVDFPTEYDYLAKIVIALSWTLAGLASYVPPSVFFGERAPHFISERQGMVTVANGFGSRTLISFQPSSMITLVGILAEGLLNPLLCAADLMWIGAGLVRIQKVKSGPGQPVPVEPEAFEIFLSHRGRDAKRQLSETVQKLPHNHGIFLDCMSLPHGVINRSFVFGSLAKSKQIVIVETENFNESEWCRKEAWLADMMSVQNLARVDRMVLGDATTRIAADGDLTVRRRSNQGRRYPISHRVLRDIDYWARTPNLHSLKKGGHATECLIPLLSMIESAPRPDDLRWVRSIGETVLETLAEVVAAAPDAEPIDMWSTALQLSLAAFAAASDAHSKNDVRLGIDHLNATLKAIITSELHRSNIFTNQPAKYLALLAAASAIDLSGFNLDSRMLPALIIALEGVAAVRDGLILLDVREPGNTRDFRLHLIAALVQNNLGSVGIVQDAADEVHNGRVDRLSLEILPCVTLHPGMEDPF